MVDHYHHNRLGTSDSEPKPPLIGVALLPSAATLGNLLCGVLAILCCLLAIRSAYFDVGSETSNRLLRSWFPTYIAVGAYLVVLAMVFDGLDGRLARMARHTTEFGAQLDSIADVVSFGAAPALLFLTLLLPLAVPAEGASVVNKLEWRVGLLGALVYVSCAAIRLARYNAENIEEEAAQPNFRGLPVPGAAAGVVALLVLHEDLVFEDAHWFGLHWAGWVRRAIGPAAFLLGMLMVSRLDYVHVVNRYVRREQPLIHLVWLVILVSIGIYSPQILLAVLATVYVLSGIVLRLTRRRPKKVATQAREDRSRVDAPR
ncbi:MAG: CDP-alcohol phosphatidyltransferase family protein [Phycisphaerae bacterium]